MVLLWIHGSAEGCFCLHGSKDNQGFVWDAALGRSWRWPLALTLNQSILFRFIWDHVWGSKQTEQRRSQMNSRPQQDDYSSASATSILFVFVVLAVTFHPIKCSRFGTGLRRPDRVIEEAVKVKMSSAKEDTDLHLTLHVLHYTFYSGLFTEKRFCLS